MKYHPIKRWLAPPLRIVKPLDVVEDICARLAACPIGFSPDPFGFQRKEEALHRSVVPDISGSAHRACDALISNQPLERLAGVLAALVRVVQKFFRSAPAPDRHDQGVCDHLEGHLIAHGPTTRRENTTMTAAKESQRSAVQT